jgi:TonB family protein
MQIPRYLPLAQQAGLSGEVTLHLTVDKAGKVVSVDVENSRPSNWGKGFASMAIEAAKQSEFLCASCLGDTFEHALPINSSFQQSRETLAPHNRNFLPPKWIPPLM